MQTIQLANLLPLSLISHEMLTNALSNSVSNVNNKISALVKAGDLVRLKKGFYCFSADYHKQPVDLLAIANGLYAPSYVSFEYALSLHGVIPERVVQITSATSKNNKLFDTPLGRFSYKKVPIQAYSLGVDWEFDEVEGGRFFATLEKALCDKIRYENGLGTLTQKQMLEYLEFDLRADLPTNINLELIEVIATAYRSRNLKTLVTILRKRKK